MNNKFFKKSNVTMRDSVSSTGNALGRSADRSSKGKDGSEPMYMGSITTWLRECR